MPVTDRERPSGPHTLPGGQALELRLRRVRLRVVDGDDAGAELVTDRERCVIGSHEAADLRLSDRTVSRFHCELTIQPGRVALADLGSTNGTFVDGVQVERCSLHPGAVLRVGATRVAFEDAGQTARVALSPRVRFGTMVGGSEPMRRVFDVLEHAARTDSTILLSGETGTGKEAAAESIHAESGRAEGPFVVVDCGALPATLLESELFGHERGSFTGAQGRREGRFKQADGGTLFLDEVSEIPLPLQVKLLRFLQEREFERVGGNETIRVDVRIVAASNRDLASLVESGEFREDLFYRLNVIRLDVPPLRARKSDVPLLATHFLRRFARENEREIDGFTDEAMRALVTYPWPGNVRELENAIERAVVLCPGDRITPDLLPAVGAADAKKGEGELGLMIPGLSMAEVERVVIERTLEAVDGSTAKAAEMLGISRRKIQYRLREWSDGTLGGESEEDD